MSARLVAACARLAGRPRPPRSSQSCATANLRIFMHLSTHHRYTLRYILVGDRSKQRLVWAQMGYIHSRPLVVWPGATPPFPILYSEYRASFERPTGETDRRKPERAEKYR